MNRKEFLKRFGVGVVAAPVVAKAMTADEEKTLDELAERRFEKRLRIFEDGVV